MSNAGDPATTDLDPGDAGLLVRGHVAGRLDAVVEDLALLVDTETPSTSPALLAAGADVLVRWLALRWPGARIERIVGDAAAAGSREAATVLQADLPGPLPGTVVLLGHHDTVFDAGTTAQRPFAVTGEHLDGRDVRVARGPGVFDMKCGIVQGVHAVAALDALGIPRPTVRLLLNADEEVGSLGSRSVLVRQATGALAVLVLEPGGGPGTVKHARKGVGLWDVTATGVAAHAGLDPDSGASAVHALAELTCHLAGLADRAAGTTVNVGVLTGGTRPNVVAAGALLQLDVRARTWQEAERVERGLLAWAPADPRVHIEVSGGWNRPPWQAGPAAMALLERARQVAAGWGLAVEPREVGGASDGNLLADAGITVLDGLGASGGGAHAEHEHAVLDDVGDRAGLLAGLLAQVHRG